jgi:hypothetical protein
MRLSIVPYHNYDELEGLMCIKPGESCQNSRKL